MSKTLCNFISAINKYKSFLGETHMSVDVHDMTIEEKLRTMEMLWDDICRNVPEFPSPAWHQQLLREREQRIEEGKEQFVNWEQAKREIWDAVS